MKFVLFNLLRALSVWAYYRMGWMRASLKGVRIDWSSKVSPHARICGVKAIGSALIGRNVEIGSGTYLSSGLIQCARIGRYCSIGPDVIIGPSEHRLDNWTTSPFEALAAGESPDTTQKKAEPSVIGDGVWIGAKSVILQGVEIGNKAVVAAGAIVICDVPSKELWGGVPARKIRSLD
ncbi:DapH/DapD/GlmU-related protein [Variovorax sp. EBFNA2]|uniref:acyltransferase n=1 Tax=Variovorax sp. EBFNA2 TaxID=3342097 RepID=UPI0029C0910B|nr:DapH/DapD/GlmU-related protein [Variovorax boronicumulans]WPG38809.1 DapH/DapD/GlmU-related protein [Variovorax boronicumulans]